jgi:hypothetical protein
VEWTAVYGNASPVPEQRLGTARWRSVSVSHLFTDPPKSVQTKGGGATRSVLSAAEGPPAAFLNLATSDAERDGVVAAHATFDDAGSANMLEWMARAQGLPGFSSIVQKRLAVNPRDVPALRAEQDEKDPAERAAACERQQGLARAEPSSQDLAYLALRCEEKDEPRRPRAIQLWHENPKHPWIAFMAAHALADGGKWQECIEAFDTAGTLPALKEASAMTAGRVFRLTPVGRPKALLEASRLREVEALERDTGQEGPARAYSLLAQGDARRAVEAAEGSELAPRILRLAGASDGAPEGLARRALELSPDAGLDRDTSWPMIGLAVRESAPFEPYVAAIGDDAEQVVVRKLVQELRTSDVRGADALIQSLSFEQRAHAALLGAVALGKRAPDEWRKWATLALYAVERPYVQR